MNSKKKKRIDDKLIFLNVKKRSKLVNEYIRSDKRASLSL